MKETHTVLHVCQIGFIIIDKFQNNFAKTVEWVYCYSVHVQSNEHPRSIFSI